jgi:hypothetical protein
MARPSYLPVVWWLSGPKRPSKLHLLPGPRSLYALCGVYVDPSKRRADQFDGECTRCAAVARRRDA